MEGVFNFFGGRKMAFALITLITAGIAFFIGRMSEVVFVDLIKWVLLAYLGANVGDTVVEALKRPPPVA